MDELVKARFIELFGTETEFDKWPCCTIGDVADVCVGVVIKPTQYYTDKGIPAFRSLNIGEMHVKIVIGSILQKKATKKSEVCCS